jgi:AraC-like DNA-binding protein
MRATTSPFRSNFYLWNGVSAIFFSNCLTHVHSHNTMQIIVDIQDHFRCRVGNNNWQTFKNLIIRENTPHQLDTAGSVQLIIYLDIATNAAREIRTRHLEGKDAAALKDTSAPKDAAAPELNLFDDIKPDELQQVLLRPDPALLLSIISRLLRTLSGHSANPKPDDRIIPKPDNRIIIIERLLSATPPSDHRIDHLARQVHLSTSRLRSLFKQQTGVSLYKYILWTRIRFAINRIMAGSPINDAAWEAGFTDNSHFHKMLVTMFGISPSQFIRDHQTMDILTCDNSPIDFETKVYDEEGRVEKIYK